MKDIAMHILDIAQNSIRAKAAKIIISIQELDLEKHFSFEIIDNGCGIEKEMLANISDPYVTTRKTRNKGFGLALLKQNAEQCKGSFYIDSKVGEGTKLKAVFKTNNIDCPPKGDINGTLIQLMAANEDIHWKFKYNIDGNEYILDSKEVEGSLDGIAINNPEIINFLKSMLEENIKSLNL